jgi:hypothetical protein
MKESVTVSKSEKPPNGSSPISHIPIELHHYTFSYLPLRKHIELRRVNKNWQQVWERGISQIQFDISTPEDFNDL